jgi:hypothetical protein
VTVAFIGYFCNVHSEDNIMKYLCRIFLLLPLLIILFSCKTDFDVIASYKEITVVYGLLDQNNATQYLRITKAFLGEGNALVYAQVPDSSIYGPELQVSLLEVKSAFDTNYRIIVFDTITIHNKEIGDTIPNNDLGDFFYPDQLMYKSDETLNPQYSYKLKIKNSKTGHEVASKTNLISGFAIVTPKPNKVDLGFNRETLTNQKFVWRSAVNGKRYQPILTFYFKEISYSFDTIVRKIDWVFSSSTSDAVGGGDEMSVNYLNEDFYKLCESKIPYTDDPAKEDSVKFRLADHFDFTFTVVGDEFSTYLDLNGPTTGLLLEKPAYSNIENGIGVFSCHYYWHQTFLVNNLTKAALQNTSLHFFAN